MSIVDKIFAAIEDHVFECDAAEVRQKIESTIGDFQATWKASAETHCAAADAKSRAIAELHHALTEMVAAYRDQCPDHEQPSMVAAALATLKATAAA